MSRNIYFIYLISYEKVNNLLEANKSTRNTLKYNKSNMAAIIFCYFVLQLHVP